MHPRKFAGTIPDQPTIIIATDGTATSYGTFETIANQGAQLFRSLGI